MTRIHAQVKLNIPTGLRVNYRLPEIAASMHEGERRTPWGSKTASHSFGPKASSIGAELAKLSNYRATAYNDGSTIVHGSIPLPYAGIQQRGGTIPLRFAAPGRKMRGIYKGGVFFGRKAKPSHIIGKHYLERGFAAVQRRFKAIMSYQWIYKPTSVTRRFD